MSDNTGIGQLLVMQSVLINLPNQESIFEFITRGLRSLPAIQSVRMLEAEDNGRVQPHIDSPPADCILQIEPGEEGDPGIVAELNPDPEFNAYRPYLNNFFTMVRFIIRFKKQQAQLEWKNTELENALETENRLRSELILKEKILGLNPLSTIIAHEMSTPIGNITTISSSLKSITENLQNSVSEGLSKSQLLTRLDQMDHGFSDILKAAKQMSRLISRLQHLIDAGHVEPSSHFNLLQLCRDVCDMVVHNNGWKQHQMELQIEENLHICTDKGALAQILEIFLENALIHGYGNNNAADNMAGPIIIGAEQSGLKDISIWVQDFGTGIEAENLGRVFDPFYTTRLSQGRDGLGLSIAYRLTTQVLRGHVDVESSPGSGSKFSIILPGCRDN
ncbi:sensor histidine kinase [Salinispira pacifica]|uniref:histidine kinase n=1 Tax=Salinispira pacifica TaxID=1307761 RepID=V5WE28_9SPIO|nr:HAMP domain-containing sensor histidine kinase [Salinispira pacifica]AHC14048.1 Sensor histidine kinase [Salinispira pacifica]